MPTPATHRQGSLVKAPTGDWYCSLADIWTEGGQVKYMHVLSRLFTGTVDSQLPNKAP